MSKTAAIIGGGVIGGGWAARFLLNGWDVRVFDPDPEAERKIGEVLTNARAALPMLYDTALPAKGDLTLVGSLDKAVGGADWVQESVPERLEMKHAVYAQILPHLGPEAILGSSTSGFKPSELKNGLARADALVVAHPFNPVYLLPLVELVPAPDTPAEILENARKTLTSVGMHPLVVRQEIDAHIADRLLEAVWREGLWLIKDGIATTQEIDDAIRYGFGLRWAQMGLFETYRIAGGEAGMAHFIEQFGPALAWPWTKLMDVPELTPELVQEIANQSDAQSGEMSIRELERLRDNNLVAILRALKGTDAAAGAVLNAHQASMPVTASEMDAPMVTVERVIPSDWTDYNGHMNESRFGQVFSDAADAVMAAADMDVDYLSDMSCFTVDIRIRFLHELHAGEHIRVYTRVIEAKGRKLELFHSLRRTDGSEAATGEQVLLHVDMATRRAAEPPDWMADKLAALRDRHAHLPERVDT